LLTYKVGRSESKSLRQHTAVSIRLWRGIWDHSARAGEPINSDSTHRFKIAL